MAVVSRVELAAEVCPPAAFAARWWKQHCGAFDYCDVCWCAKIGNGEVIARYSPQQLRCYSDGECTRGVRRARRARELLADRFKRGRVALTEAASDGACLRSHGRGQQQETDAPVNGKDPALIVEPDQCVDVAAVQETRAKPLAALISREA